MSNLLIQLLRHRPHCYFISPHLDDAVFSAGGLMLALSGRLPLTVINVFTSSGSGINTFSARAYLKQCRQSRANRLYHLRRREDRLALKTLNAHVVNLGYTEALWRQSSRQFPLQLHRFLPELINLYPTYRFHITSGHLHPTDLQLSRELAHRLSQLINTRRPAAIFCPLGFGGHVDHILVKRACLAAFNHQLIFWSDFPYVLNDNFQPSPQFTRQRTPHSFPVDFPAKLRLCRLYRTQFPQVFQDPQLLNSPETFYPPRALKV